MDNSPNIDDYDDCDDYSYDSVGDEYDVDGNISFSVKPRTNTTNVKSAANIPPQGHAKNIKSKITSNAPKPSKDVNVRNAPIWISFAGHIDAGKSTLMAQLLEEPSPNVLDITQEEQSHGITMDLMVKRMKSPNSDIIFIDAPGHSDLIEVTCKAVTFASIILFLIDPSPNEFERGLNAQTIEHLRAIFALSNVPFHLIVVLNKMDKVSNSNFFIFQD